MTRYPLNLQKGYFLRLLQEKEHIIYQEKSTSNDNKYDQYTEKNDKKSRSKGHTGQKYIKHDLYIYY